jgi:hypothetical protein
MGFLIALLGYLAGVLAAVATIVVSVAYLVPGPQPARDVTEMSGQKAAKSKQLTPRERTRRLAERAAARL